MIYLPDDDFDLSDQDLDADPEIPDEEDLVTYDHQTVYYAGKAVIHTDPAHFDAAVSAWMEREGYYPNVFFISDHGNPHLISVNEVTA